MERLREVSIFKWIHYGKPENPLVHDVFEEGTYNYVSK